MNNSDERLYTEQDVKDKKKGSWIGGLIAGTIATITAGVVLNKVAKKNIIDGASNLVDKSVDLVKGKKKVEPTSAQISEDNKKKE
jgi:hypothetical protein